MNIRFFLFVFFLYASTDGVDCREIVVSSQGEIRTISEAIELAVEGDTIVVLPGFYKEKIKINKSLTLIGKDMPVISGDGKGTVVRIKASGVIFKGFRIIASGSNLSREDCAIEVMNSPGSIIEGNELDDVLFGIYVKNSPDCIIRNNLIVGKGLPLSDRGDGIRLWYSSGTKIIGNELVATRDLVMWWSSNTLIKGNRIRNGRYGLHYMYSDHNRFEHNVFVRNAVGGFLMYSNDIEFYYNVFVQNQGIASGYGVGFKDVDNVTARNNVFIDNRIGIYLDNSPRSTDSWNRIEKNVIAFNDIGLSLMPSIERNRFIGNSFIENTEQVEVRGGGRLAGNIWSDENGGNFWSNYIGYDSDQDGIGDIPYVYESLFEDIIDRYPSLRLFLYSPVSEAIELAAEAVPIIKPVPKLIDDKPLVSPYIPEEFVTESTHYNSNIFIFSLVVTIVVVVGYFVLNRNYGAKS